MPTSTTSLIRANIFFSLAFLSSSISMSHLVATSFSSFALLSSSVSTANLSGLLATTFSSLRIHSNSLLSPRFNLLRVARRSFSWSSVSDYLFFPSSVFFYSPSCSSFSHLILSLAFLCSSVPEALFALIVSFLSERLFLLYTMLKLF